jgi:hypothetical protein
MEQETQQPQAELQENLQENTSRRKPRGWSALLGALLDNSLRTRP